MPDHSTFSRNRHGRFCQSDILRHLFETVVERCLAEGLVGMKASRTKWGQRRVPAGGYGSEPETVRQAAAHAYRHLGKSMTMCVQPTRTQLQSWSNRANTAILQF